MDQDPRTSHPVEDDPLEALKRMKAQQQAQQQAPSDTTGEDPLVALKALRPPPKPAAPPPAPAPRPSPIASALKTAGGAVMDALGIPPVARGMVQRAVSHPLETAINVGQGVPGGKAAQAGFAMLGSRIPGMSSTGPMDYTEALASLNEATKDTPLTSRIASKVPGAMVAGSLLPAGAVSGVLPQAATGAGLSAADRALAATDESLSDRLKGTAKAGAVGAVAGPVIGKGLDYLNAIGRRFMAPAIDANLTARSAARTAASAPLYLKFRGQGDIGSTPALADLLDLPIVRRSIETVKGESPILAKLPDTDARVLDAAYKRLGSRAFAATHGFEPNEARIAFKQAIDEASGGEFSPAVDTFREHSAQMGAVKRGAQTLVNAARGRTPFNQIDTASPAAFRAFAEQATPAEQEAAAEGIAGRLKTAPLTDKLHLPLGLRIPFRPSSAVRSAPALLDQVGAGVSPRARAVALADLLASLTSR